MSGQYREIDGPRSEERQSMEVTAVSINLEKDLESFMESRDMKQVRWELDRISQTNCG